MKEVVIVSGTRTAIGAFGGSLKAKSVVELGSIVMKEVLKKVNLKPVANSLMQEIAPDKLKDQGLIELEQNASDWSDDAADIAIDEVIMARIDRLDGTGR